jgi:hypothetical protein
MIIGYPVSFSLAAVGFFFGFMSIEMGYFTMPFMQAIPGRVFGSILSNELLLAIPFFTFMGAILEKCGLAEDMLESMGQLFGPGQRRAGLLDRSSSASSSGAITGTGGGAGHRHGADHPAGDDALQVRHALRHRRAGALRHHHPAGAARRWC